MQFLQWLRNHLIVVPSSRYRCSSSWRSGEGATYVRTSGCLVILVSGFASSLHISTCCCRNCWLLQKFFPKNHLEFLKNSAPHRINWIRHLVCLIHPAKIQNEILEVLVGFWTSTIWRPPKCSEGVSYWFPTQTSTFHWKKFWGNDSFTNWEICFETCMWNVIYDKSPNLT